MKILDYLKVESINLNLESKDKKGIIKELYSGLSNCPEVVNKEKCYDDLIEREKIGTTGIGKNVAIPHAKTEAVTNLIMTIGISKNNIQYESVDEEPVRIFFMFLSPINMSQEYLTLLAKISRYIKDDEFRNTLLEAKTKEEIVEILNKKDR